MLNVHYVLSVQLSLYLFSTSFVRNSIPELDMKVPNFYAMCNCHHLLSAASLIVFIVYISTFFHIFPLAICYFYL